MASLAGKLLQDCNIIFVGRLFINRLLASKKRASCFSHFIYLEESFRDDIEWLLEAIQIQNGVSFLVPLTPILTGCSKTHHALVPIITCSTNTILCSPVHFRQVHISDLELLAHVLVARVWGTQFVSQQKQIFHKFIMTTELSPPGSTKENCLADAYSRMTDTKCQQIIQNFTNNYSVRPTQRHIPPEIFLFHRRRSTQKESFVIS